MPLQANKAVGASPAYFGRGIKGGTEDVLMPGLFRTVNMKNLEGREVDYFGTRYLGGHGPFWFIPLWAAHRMLDGRLVQSGGFTSGGCDRLPFACSALRYYITNDTFESGATRPENMAYNQYAHTPAGVHACRGSGAGRNTRPHTHRQQRERIAGTEGNRSPERQLRSPRKLRVPAAPNTCTLLRCLASPDRFVKHVTYDERHARLLLQAELRGIPWAAAGA